MAKAFQSIYEKPEKSMIEELVLNKQENSNIFEKYLLAIIDSSLDGIAVVNEKGKFEFGNESFFKISGWLKEEIIGQPFMKMIPEDTREFVKGHWQAVQMDHGGVHEIKIMTREGEIKYLNVASSWVEINGENKVVAIVHDISENKKQEIYLKESESKYRKLFENANDGIFAHDNEGYFTSVNKTALEILGETDEKKVVGAHFSTWLTPESTKIALDALKKAVSHEITYASLKLEVVRPDNEHRWIEVNAWVIQDGNRVTGINGIARDVTEKLKLEEKLKASEELYKDLFENANDPMYTHDIEGNFLSVNKLGFKILGGTEEEIIGTNISKWLTPESYRLFVERAQKVHAGEPVEEPVVIEVVSKNGEHRWGEVRTRLIRKNDKIIVHGICRDITENILLKQELKKSNKQRKLLCYLIEGTRGGKTRASILKNLIDRSYNANQLATVMNMDYKTIRHHLDVLIKNGIITKGNDGYTDLYFISKNIELNLNDFNRELLHNKS